MNVFENINIADDLPAIHISVFLIHLGLFCLFTSGLQYCYHAISVHRNGLLMRYDLKTSMNPL